MQPSRRIHRRTIGRSKHHARSSNRGAHRADARDAHTHGAGSLIPRARDHRSSRAQSRCLCARRRDLAAHLRRFEQCRKQLLIDSSLGQHFLRPSPVRHIEQQRARCIRHVDGAFPGEAKPHVIFGQHDMCHPRPRLRLVLAHPQKLGQREIRQRRIAGEPDQRIAPEKLLQFQALRLASLIAPDQRRPHHFIRGIEQNRAVHLPRESDARNILRAHRPTIAAPSAPPRRKPATSPADPAPPSRALGWQSADAPPMPKPQHFPAHQSPAPAYRPFPHRCLNRP